MSMPKNERANIDESVIGQTWEGYAFFHKDHVTRQELPKLSKVDLLVITSVSKLVGFHLEMIVNQCEPS